MERRVVREILGDPGLLEHVDWRGKTIMAAIADNAAAVFGSTRGSPSSCAWVDRLRLAYAKFIHAHGIGEFFVPAQHDSHATHEVAMWQKTCDALAKEAADQAKAWSIPFRSLLSEFAFLFWKGKLVMDAPKTVDACYTTAQGFNLPQGMREAGRTWQETVVRQFLTQGALKNAFWARTAPWCHVAESPDFSARFVGESVVAGGTYHARMLCLASCHFFWTSLQQRNSYMLGAGR